jgi:hypothetical protein
VAGREYGPGRARPLSPHDSLSAACLAACGRLPDASDLRWAPIDLVPAAEIADIGNSSLSTPYTAWAIAARHQLRRERRLTWRAGRKIGAENAAKIAEGIDEPVSAALLESLLLRDMMAWSQRLGPVQREQLLNLDPAPLPSPFLTLQS